MSVNAPTNTKLKEQDVNAKLQLYGIYSAFANGKAPSNKQIDVAMNTALEWNGLNKPHKDLSSDGKQLVADLRDVIEKAKILLLTKNEGNLIQDFIWQTQTIGTNDAKVPQAGVDKETARQHGNEALEGLRTLGQLIITNGQFRKLLSDATVLLRDVAGDAATNTAQRVKPSEDQLSQIDRPAEDNTWHEAPDLSKDNLRSQVQSRVPINTNKQDIKQEAKVAAGDATQAADPAGSRDPTVAADRAAVDQQQGTASGVDAKKGGDVAAKNMKNKFSERMDDDQKERMRQYRQRTNKYFEEKVPKERRDQTIFRLKKMIVEIQMHQDYQQAIDTLLRLAEEYEGHSRDLATQGSGAAKGAHSQGGIHGAEADLKTLLERFANGTSFDDLMDSINQIYRDADQDPELKNWFRTLNRYIRRCLQEQGYIIEEESNQEWHQIHDKGKFLLRDRYRDHTNHVLDEFKFLAGQFEEDPQNKAFALSMDKLFNDLGHDSAGNQEFKPHLLKDLTEVLLPQFFENVRYIPIPRIEFSDSAMDAVVENLVIEGDNLAPNMFEFGSDNYWRWGRKGFQSKNKNKVMLSVSGVQMDLRDVAYYIKKKEGFPSVTDKGIMDIFLGGTGLSFKVAMETADKTDRNHFFKINNVNVDIKHMSIKVKQSNHKLLFSLFKPLLLKVMRPAIQKAVEKAVRDNVTKADAFMYRVKQETDRATEEAKSAQDPQQVKNIYTRYFNAFQRELTRGKEKTQSAKENAGKVNVAMTQHDSMFQNITLPGGISTKATEYRDLAAKGDKWESPVFSIGSAKESSSLPSVSNPVRKPHNTRQGGLRGEGSLTGANSGLGSGSGLNPAAGSTQGVALGGAGVPNSAIGDKSNTNGGLSSNTGSGLSGPEHTTLGSDNPVYRGQI